MAQLAEQLICNQQVFGSSPNIGSYFFQKNKQFNGRIPEWPKGTDCKSAALCFGGSNPPPPICRCGGIGRRAGLKIPWWQHRVGSSPTTGISMKRHCIRCSVSFFVYIYDIPMHRPGLAGSNGCYGRCIVYVLLVLQ